ncbi:MAG: ATP-binding cassette domain-containing protein [Chloroflexi bacterium]|nr:ATP-binding cassette domain-containing protein [Chloroflexota bacterium]
MHSLPNQLHSNFMAAISVKGESLLKELPVKAAWQTIYTVVRYYPRVLKLVWQANPRYALYAITLAIFDSLTRPAQENIGFGQIEFVDDRERVAWAAHQGGAYPVVEKLPLGFDTVLGRTFDGSVDLSGGEWQKLALSRAFMRDAQMLILDEPTASLDALAEYEVYQRFAELAAGKTTVFISHRFSTVRMAGHILVLQNGLLVEEGTHDALLARDGQYARMFNVQAEPYR